MTGDWQRHHLIPRGLSASQRYPDIAAMLDAAGRRAPQMVRATIALPTREALAARTGLPVHRGPHPAYDDWVAARLALMVPVSDRLGGPPIDLLAGLQLGLRTMLSQGVWGRRLADRTPMADASGHVELDTLVDRLGDRLFGMPPERPDQTSR